MDSGRAPPLALPTSLHQENPGARSLICSAMSHARSICLYICWGGSSAACGMPICQLSNNIQAITGLHTLPQDRQRQNMEANLLKYLLSRADLMHRWLRHAQLATSPTLSL